MPTPISPARVLTLDEIQTRILVLRGHRVLLDSDLASFYGVPTHRLNQAVKRNGQRFPADLCFQLSTEELSSNSSQIVMSSRKHRGASYRPFGFPKGNPRSVTIPSGKFGPDGAALGCASGRRPDPPLAASAFLIGLSRHQRFLVRLHAQLRPDFTQKTASPGGKAAGAGSPQPDVGSN